jgi:hypothetical protein
LTPRRLGVVRLQPIKTTGSISVVLAMVLKSFAALTLVWYSRAASYASPQGAVVPDGAFLALQTLVPVEGARRLNLFGGGMMFWRHIMLPLGTLTRICAYDRAGYGFSDPATRASDAVHAVDDLHRLLKADGIPVPVVYVGHSIVGLYAMLFAAHYPDELSGAVLIDPSIAHEDAVMAASSAGRGDRCGSNGPD